MSTRVKAAVSPICGRVGLRIEEKTGLRQDASGLLLPEESTDRGAYRKATVYALPLGYEGELKIGDEVLCPPWGTHEVRVNGIPLSMVKAEEIPCVLE